MRALPTGVSMKKGRFFAMAHHQGRRHCLGGYSTPEEASAAYQKFIADKPATALLRRKHLSVEERFWFSVEKGSSCWEWQAAKNSHGYGVIQANGKLCGAHRVSWELHNGPVPDGLSVLHHCDNRVCVRPDHLFVGTVVDNTNDMVAKGRQAQGTVHGSAKLTDRQVEAMRQARKEGLSYTEIGKAFGVHKTTARRAVIGLTWQQTQKEGA